MIGVVLDTTPEDYSLISLWLAPAATPYSKERLHDLCSTIALLLALELEAVVYTAVLVARSGECTVMYGST